MTASDLFKAGKLQEAVQAQLQAVKNDPGNEGKRWFLFDLLGYGGDLERATRQIAAMQPTDPQELVTWQAHRALLESEQSRRKLFSEGLTPQFFAEPPASITLRLQALDALRGEQPVEAARLLDSANREMPLLQGTFNDRSFQGLRDADDLLAGVLEVFARGRYYWVPLEHIRRLQASAPVNARDLLWLRARLETTDDACGDVWLPTLYPNTHEAADDKLKLGRVTDWKAVPQGPTLGVGQHLFLLGDEDRSLLEVRDLCVG